MEVQRGGGERCKHVAKWRNQLALQGFIAICAESTPVPALQFIREAREMALAPLGVVTDLATLATAPPSRLVDALLAQPLCARDAHRP